MSGQLSASDTIPTVPSSNMVQKSVAQNTVDSALLIKGVSVEAVSELLLAVCALGE